MLINNLTIITTNNTHNRQIMTTTISSSINNLSQLFLSLWSSQKFLKKRRPLNLLLMMTVMTLTHHLLKLFKQLQQKKPPLQHNLMMTTVMTLNHLPNLCKQQNLHNQHQFQLKRLLHQHNLMMRIVTISNHHLKLLKLLHKNRHQQRKKRNRRGSLIIQIVMTRIVIKVLSTNLHPRHHKPLPPSRLLLKRKEHLMTQVTMTSLLNQQTNLQKHPLQKQNQ